MVEPAAGLAGSAADERSFARRGNAVLALIALLIALQALRGRLSPEADAQFVLSLAFVPAAWTRVFDPGGVAEIVERLLAADAAAADDIALLLGPGSLRWWTILTYALLHGGWTHVLVNSVWLAAFGSAVARRFGVSRFLLFFLVTAGGGALAHWLTHVFDFTPMVGASAGLSGAMAAAARFAFAPGAPLGPAARRGRLDAYLGPSLPLRFLFQDRRVLTFVAVWFFTNLVSGLLIRPTGLADASIAWEAHIGGFLTGLALFHVFDPVRQIEPPAGDAPR